MVKKFTLVVLAALACLAAFTSSVQSQTVNFDIPADAIITKVDSYLSCSKYDGWAGCWYNDEDRRDRFCNEHDCQRKERFNYKFSIFGGTCNCCKC